MRTIFRDEVLLPYGGSAHPQYNITANAAGASDITLANEVAQAGTPLDAGTLNNLYDFDNLAGQAGFDRVTESVGSTLVESIVAHGTGALAARRETSFPAGGIDIVETVYDGTFILRRTKQTIRFTSSAIQEEVADI